MGAPHNSKEWFAIWSRSQ